MTAEPGEAAADQALTGGGVCAVLRNPTAGRGRHRARVAAAVQALAGSGLTVRELPARSVDEALGACRAAVAEGATALVAVGGDGTVHLAAQAVIGTGVAFGVVPAGTGNDFAAAVGIPTEPVAAATAIAQALRQGRTRPVDAARIDGPDGFRRHFVAVLGAGFDALVNERANRMRWPRGRRRYDIAIFAELLGLHSRRYRLTLDGQSMEVDALLVAVGNTPSYGGGMRICPAAEYADGILDVIIGRVSRIGLLRLQPKVYDGTHVLDPRVTSLRARTITIDADDITAYADGERTCRLPITVTVEPGALRLLA